MPTSCDQTPDSLDLDYFYSNYAGSVGIAIYETEPSSVRAISNKFRPTKCLTMNLRNNLATHFFPVPPTTTVIKCMCGQFHTQFKSKDDKVYDISATAAPTTTNSQTKKLEQELRKSTSNVPPSPILFIHIHTCSRCNALINCKVSNNNHDLQNNAIFYKNQAYHNSCLLKIYKEYGSF